MEAVLIQTEGALVKQFNRRVSRGLIDHLRRGKHHNLYITHSQGNIKGAAKIRVFGEPTDNDNKELLSFGIEANGARESMLLFGLIFKNDVPHNGLTFCHLMKSIADLAMGQNLNAIITKIPANDKKQMELYTASGFETVNVTCDFSQKGREVFILSADPFRLWDNMDQQIQVLSANNRQRTMDI